MVRGAFLFLFVLWADIAYTQTNWNPPICSSPDQIYIRGGRYPWNYRDSSETGVWRVGDITRAHIKKDVYSQLRSRNPDVQRLIGGLVYTLERMPNHYDALRLWSVVVKKFGRAPIVNLDHKFRKDPSRLFSFPLYPECFLQRAVAYTPEDPVVWMLFAMFLHATGEYEASLARYEHTLEISPRWSEAHYNKGLLLFDMGRYEEARKEAREARRLGYPLNGLLRKLEAVEGAAKVDGDNNH